jgi:hypothetical protein
VTPAWCGLSLDPVANSISRPDRVTGIRAPTNLVVTASQTLTFTPMPSDQGGEVNRWATSTSITCP